MTAPSRAAANWYPDPLGRGEYRYWDGERWTQWIANGGVSRPDTFDLPEGLPEPSLLSTLPGAAPAPFAGTTPYPLVDSLRYRSIAGLTTALTWLLVAAIVGAAAFAVTTGNHLSKVQDLFTDGSVTFSDVQDAADARNGTFAILELISIAILVLFIIYLFRASKNTELWDTSKRTWTPGWAIAGWFIPLANFVIPLLVVLDVWRRTPERSVGSELRTSPPATFVVLWWVFFLIGSVGTRLDIDPFTVNEHKTQDWIYIVSGVALAIAAACLIPVVRDLARRQRATAFSDG